MWYKVRLMLTSASFIALQVDDTGSLLRVFSRIVTQPGWDKHEIAQFGSSHGLVLISLSAYSTAIFRLTEPLFQVLQTKSLDLMVFGQAGEWSSCCTSDISPFLIMPLKIMGSLSDRRTRCPCDWEGFEQGLGQIGDGYNTPPLIHIATSTLKFLTVSCSA